MERLLQIIFSFGFLKWVWDGGCLIWRNSYRNRITADVHVAYHTTNDEGELEKSSFLVVRNGTDKDVVVTGFVFEDHWWFRTFGRSDLKPVFAETILMTVPAGKGLQMGFPWLPVKSLIIPHRYFGVLIRNRPHVWVPTKRWKGVLREYKADFPNWESYRHELEPFRFKCYGRQSQQSLKNNPQD